MLSRYTHTASSIHCCKFKFSFAFISFSGISHRPRKINNTFSVLVSTKVKINLPLPITACSSMMEKRNGFIESQPQSWKNVQRERGHWSSEKLESNIAFIGRIFRFALQQHSICDLNNVSNLRQAKSVVFYIKNIIITLKTCFSQLQSCGDLSEIKLFAILQTFKSCKRRKNNRRRQFCFRARKEEGKEKGRIGIYDASINNVNASEKNLCGLRLKISNRNFQSQWNALNS